jgi:4-hydroxybenzoate polyprenyltransferase
VLATATDRIIAESVAQHIGCFSNVLASDGSTNLKGKRKLASILAITGEGPFAYAGNAVEDLSIWAAAQERILVSTSRRVNQEVATLGGASHHLPADTSRLNALVRALRPQQWPKNLLVYVALLTSLSFGDPLAWLRATQAFLAFCLVASGIYILNDLLDLAADRRHPTKRRRPFAAGQLEPQFGILASASTTTAGLLLGFLLPWPSFFWLLAYYVLSVAYSLTLKSWLMIDVLVLAALYALRVIIGAAAIGVVPSFWLLAFAIFIFLSLAVLKRVSEIRLLASRVRDTEAGAPSIQTMLHGRGYRHGDEPTLRTLGIASGVASVVLMALYINAPENASRFAAPQLLWLICPLLLYWIAVVWIKSERGELHDDPVSFALRDPGTRLLVLAICGVFLLAALW